MFQEQKIGPCSWDIVRMGKCIADEVRDASQSQIRVRSRRVSDASGKSIGFILGIVEGHWKYLSKKGIYVFKR